ncbi:MULTISPECIES: hypothetical protein [unclassified Streptomyces]|uniref:hypothetical protein n=1 Tax=unclassified Streptomyces TaxID=2593676 RepID=UPI003D90B309
MSFNNVAAQLVSMLISVLGLVLFRFVARFVPEDPPPVPRDDSLTKKAHPEGESADG